MINNEVINKVYSKFLVTDHITIKELIELGLKTNDIKKLFLLNYITMDSAGNYMINDVDSLYQFGKELLQNNRVEEAYKIFKKCHELDNKNDDINYELYFVSLDNKDYKSSFDYFNNLSVGKNR